MLIVKQKLTLLKVAKREGTKKDGSPYLFYGADFLDNDSNVLRMNLNNNLSADKELTKKLEGARQIPCIVDFNLTAAGFNLKGTVVKVEL